MRLLVLWHSLLFLHAISLFFSFLDLFDLLDLSYIHTSGQLSSNLHHILRLFISHFSVIMYAWICCFDISFCFLLYVGPIHSGVSRWSATREDFNDSCTRIHVHLWTWWQKRVITWSSLQNMHYLSKKLYKLLIDTKADQANGKTRLRKKRTKVTNNNNPVEYVLSHCLPFLFPFCSRSDKICNFVVYENRFSPTFIGLLNQNKTIADRTTYAHKWMYTRVQCALIIRYIIWLHKAMCIKFLVYLIRLHFQLRSGKAFWNVSLHEAQITILIL